MKFWEEWHRKKVKKDKNVPDKLEPADPDILKTIQTANYSVFTMRVTNSEHIMDTVMLSHN